MPNTHPKGQRRQRPIGPDDPRRATHKRQGLTRAQVDALVRLQGNACALCRKPITADTCFVDHDHRKAVAHGHAPERGCPRCVRGLLDRGCQWWLHSFRDDEAFIERALAYVRGGLRAVMA
jgi:hypothetical protein